MTAIKRLKGLGLSLKDVAATLDNSQRQIAFFEQKIAELRNDLHELEEARRELLEECKACDPPVLP